MKETLDIITQYLLIIVLVLQIAFLIYFAYINYKRFQEDKKCWEQRVKAAEEIHDLAENIENEYKKYLESKSKLDDSKECSKDEKTIEESTNKE